MEEEDQITHLLRLEEASNAEEILSKSDVKYEKLHLFTVGKVCINTDCAEFFFSTDIFKLDPNFLENEDKYKEIKRG